MSEETTQPTLESILTEMRVGFRSLEKKLDIIESQLVQSDARIDRFEGSFDHIRADILGLRASFKEFKLQFKMPVE
jgi:hypothetical protein